MKLKDAMKVLKDHNIWRRGETEDPMTSPKELGIAIDTILEDYENYNDIEAHLDDDYDSSTTGWGVTHFNSIQDAINKAHEEDRIIVYAGTYSENIEINKPEIKKELVQIKYKPSVDKEKIEITISEGDRKEIVRASSSW